MEKFADELKQRGASTEGIDASTGDLKGAVVSDVVNEVVFGALKDSEAPKDTFTKEPSVADHTKRILAAAAKEAGSLADDDLVITFNNDLFQDHVQHSSQEVLVCCVGVLSLYMSGWRGEWVC